MGKRQAFSSDDLLAAEAAAERAGRSIPPAWPLTATVAVNPFLGQAGLSLADTRARLARAGGIPVTMPLSWYQERIAAGVIRDEDLLQAWKLWPDPLRPADLAALKGALLGEGARGQSSASRCLPTIAELAAEVSGIDWPALFDERFGVWAAGFFDRGQALWAAPSQDGAYASWRAFASRDLTPEIHGLAQFTSQVIAAPGEADAVVRHATRYLEVPLAGAESYFHQLLLCLGGWSQHGRYLHWQADQAGRPDPVMIELLAIPLIWEQALFSRYADRLSGRWAQVRAVHAAPALPGHDDVLHAILQEALEFARQRTLAQALETPADTDPGKGPAMQAVFCIDVRSEPLRRALEAFHPSVQTRGFAGFFGLRVAHRRFASDVPEARLPVLLQPTLSTCSGGPADRQADQAARIRARSERAWGRFRVAAVSCFAFVEAAGALYGWKLLRDALGRAAASGPEPAPRMASALAPEEAVGIAESVLRAMSLTQGFAPLVLIVGHAAAVVNNPHASALQCGACGGHSGEVNARLLAGLLNQPEVRRGLAARDIVIPARTRFVGAVHDTVSDELTIHDDAEPDLRQRRDLAQARTWLDRASAQARAERTLRLPDRSGAQAPDERGRDWSQIRPEWGLAGCQAFLAARRQHTVGKNLAGRIFLHDYDWRQDPDFAVLELILTAPVPVASWISLQYYGATVAPDHFGAGNKLLHNVTGGMGVVEGNGGRLRTGLPWQSVHDGSAHIHEPLRLTVCIEAPCDAIAAVLRRHAEVRTLFDQRWLHLFALDDQGRLAWRYAGDLQWVALPSSGVGTPGWSD